ncbi:MAG: saccharopine dehydrogenase NADP-binding domain-containing protein [Cytophagaceae bacterium]|nr:saccharopine dehydrogenase NADP-binding domain-containing protein [Cytophagaceae bacterium]MDW8456131.1 saccharopine dehydrogenase C-terminal domain-containing protein [Cytophagaceae bacterium]
MYCILVLGCGRSSVFLLKYLSEHASTQEMKILVADVNISEHSTQMQNIEFHVADLSNELLRQQLISQADLVISLLPPAMHASVAHDCLIYRKHLLTASYATPEILKLHFAARESGITIMMECGLDPGIDHMSAMQEIDHIKNTGGKILSFKSYTGGLPAPESCDGLWNYKITWNPRNVVLAGQGTASFLKNGCLKYVPYHRLFRTLESIHIEGIGHLQGYPNRDSLSYIERYGLQDCHTFIRGTLRYKGFCEAWDVLVQLGYTEDSYIIHNTDKLTWLELSSAFLPEYNPSYSLEHNLSNALKCEVNEHIAECIRNLGLFENEPVLHQYGSPAYFLQKRLEEKWAPPSDYVDMIVMLHELEYFLDEVVRKRSLSLIVKGDDNLYTAMAKTVGMPLAVAASMFRKGLIKKTGVLLPVDKTIYPHMLTELRMHGIRFDTKEQVI